MPKKIKLYDKGQVLATINYNPDNLILVHSNFNLESTGCTQQFDSYKIKGIYED